VLIYQMLLQQSPFRGEDEDEIYDAILADEPLYPIHMPRDSVSVLQKLLIREPESRLGSGPTDAQEIMSHAFFRNINWDDVYHKRIAPPFMPTISNPTDTSNFDQEFTSVTPVLTPVQSGMSLTIGPHPLFDIPLTFLIFSPFAGYARRVPWLLLYCGFCLTALCPGGSKTHERFWGSVVCKKVDFVQKTETRLLDSFCCFLNLDYTNLAQSCFPLIFYNMNIG
jgi:serine/threonine protein kinase